jgi:DNA-binding NarL/FixJ family response regulator
LTEDCLIDVFGSVSEVDELPQNMQPSTGGDVLIFDGRQSPGELGNVIRWWKRRHPRSRTVAIDLEGTEPIVDWVASGLDAFVSAEAHLEELRDTVVDAVHGQFHCPAAVVTSVVARIRAVSSAGKQDTADQVLTARETEILRLLAEGLSNKEIASRLDISVYTVKNHVHNLLTKMEVRHRRHAILLAIDKGLLLQRRAIREPARAVARWVTH